MTLSGLLWSLVGLSAALYLGAIAVMAIFQRHFLYRPPKGTPETPATAATPWMQPVRDQAHLLGWYCPPPHHGGKVLVFFHGNRGTLARVAQKTKSWRGQGLGIFAATYRGYEGNPGKPDEPGLYEDARAALDWLTGAGISNRQIILYGESLGTGVAAQMAIERGVHAVILEAPYTNMPRLAAEHCRWIPCRWLMQDQFDTLSKISSITAPLLLLHGDQDRTIAVDHAYQLSRAAPNARLEIIPNAAHLDLHEKGATEKLWFFINNVGLPSGNSSPIMPLR